MYCCIKIFYKGGFSFGLIYLSELRESAVILLILKYAVKLPWLYLFNDGLNIVDCSSSFQDTARKASLLR